MNETYLEAGRRGKNTWPRYLLGVVCGIFWYLKRQELGATDPVTASFLASMFFFVLVGFLLGIMGNADIPDLKVRPSADGNKGNNDQAS